VSEWAVVREYAAAPVAELHRQILERAGIPVMLRGPIAGVFGPGFAGPTAQGVTLLVPADRHDDAVELLSED
jgi:hypothetical protein